jgi:WD40 repeat protein
MIGQSVPTPELDSDDSICISGHSGNLLFLSAHVDCVGEITSAHRMPVRDVSFAHASEHRIVSGGDDCKLRVWDLR